jgi:ATP-dependent DNA ligase
VYLATDLLHLDGTPTLAWPFERRLDTLRRLVLPDTHLQVPDWVAAEGHAFWEAAEERGLAAVLARRSDARYHAGVASPDRLRIAIEERVDLVVLGVELDRDGHQVIHLGEHVDGRLESVGRAQQSWGDVVAGWLRRHAEELRVDEPPHAGADGRGVVWLRPHLTATVRHGGRAGDGSLRFPVAVALREDLDPAGCVRRLPAPTPPDQPRPGGFRPTVLATLPFTDPRPAG